MKYIVIELQKLTDGTVANLVYSYDTKKEAESKYYAILSAAAVSKIPAHSAIILQEDAMPIAYKSFVRAVSQEGA